MQQAAPRLRALQMVTCPRSWHAQKQACPSCLQLGLIGPQHRLEIEALQWDSWQRFAKAADEETMGWGS